MVNLDDVSVVTPGVSVVNPGVSVVLPGVYMVNLSAWLESDVHTAWDRQVVSVYMATQVAGIEGILYQARLGVTYTALELTLGEEHLL